MNVIDLKLIEAYTVLVLASLYIVNETDRTRESQKVVPTKYKNEVEIKVAEKTIEILENQI